MTLPYQEFKEEIIQITNMTDKNIEIFGVLPTYISKTPAFIIPDGTIMHMTIAHTGADFYEDIETCVNLIKSSNDKLELKQKLETLRKNLFDDCHRFKSNRANITTGDVKNYFDVEVQGYFPYNKGIRNLFSEAMQSTLVSVTKSKKHIYDYFIYVLNQSDNLIEALRTYPSTLKKINFQEIIQNLEDNKKELLKSFDIEIIEMFNRRLTAFADDPLNHVTDPHFMQDFVVLSAGVDKIETQVKNTITTTRLNPNEFYFNYKLMGYNIVEIPAVSFDEKSQLFIKREQSDYSIVANEDKKYAEEIELIKKKVPYRDRPKYFI